MNNYSVDVSEANFDRLVIAQSHEVPVVVDFWAPWCGPCRVIGPLLEKLAGEAQGAFWLAKLNVDANPNLSSQYGVQGIPAVKAFRDGRVVAEFVGAQPEPRVRDFIRKVAPTAADRALAEAQSLLATRHWAQAEAAFRKVPKDQADQGQAAFGLLKALLAQGKGCEAQTLLDEASWGDEVAGAEMLRSLTGLLCEVEAGDLPIDETDLDALYHQSARLLARGQFEAGLDGLLDVLRQDKKYRQRQPRLVMLGVFELLGEEDPVTQNYRRELASVLF